LDHTFYLQLDSLSEKHPALRQYRYKIEGLGVERRLKKEQLKPNLNFSYTPLSEPINNNPVSGLSLNNYTWGVEFSMPIFLRKERGDLAITNFKLKESLLDLRNKNAEITYKAVASLNTWTVTHSQANLYQKTVRDYAGLLNGERQKFDAGESSVFLVNRRELGYINAQVKLIALLAKNYKAALGAEYALGLLE
jgi:outer membrane protein TolC